MENQLQSYNYSSCYNVVPATVGALMAYFGSRFLGIENMEEPLALGGIIGGVHLSGIIHQKIQGMKPKSQK